MALKKISDLDDGGTASAADLFEVERPGTPATSRKVTLGKATFAEFNSATEERILSNESVWASLTALTDAATIAVNFNQGYDFGGAGNAPLQLSGNRTLGAPGNARTGKKGVLWFGASGATRTLTLHANWLLFDDVEAGPYEIETTGILGVAYVCISSSVYVTGILRRS